jgi:acyl-CoA reductase-like NAD-dependent aldehyde dehydrogenase
VQEVEQYIAGAWTPGSGTDTFTVISPSDGTDAIDLMMPEPRGGVAAITPWNDPIAISCVLLGAALVTGNTVVYKSSERTPATGQELTRILAAELPAAVQHDPERGVDLSLPSVS